MSADADRIRQMLLERWGAERETARHAAQVILDGPGRLGFHRAAVVRAGEQLTAWHAGWAPHLPGLPADTARLTQAAAGPDNPNTVRLALDAAARLAAEDAHPEHATLTAAADAAGRTFDAAQRELDRARYDHDNRHGTTDRADYARQLVDTERALAATSQQLTDIRTRITTLQTDPALLTQPPQRLQQEHDTWRARRDAAQRAARTRPRPSATAEQAVHHPRPEDLHHYARLHEHARGRGIGR